MLVPAQGIRQVSLGERALAPLPSRDHHLPVSHPRSTIGAEAPPLARKPNYGFEKRKKEMDRKAKKDAKREDRRRRREERLPYDASVPPPPDGGAAGSDEGPVTP